MPDLKVTDDSPQRVGFFDELNSPNTPAYTLPRVAGTSGQVITIDANGDCNFQSTGSIGTLGSIEFRALPYYDSVNAAADDWNPAGKSITPEVIFNLSLISYSATKANNTWRYDETTGLTFTGGTENTGVSRPALEFATHTDGITNPNVTGNFIYTDAGGTDYTFSFRIDWILIQEGAAGSDGAAGTAARGVTLTASDQSIEYDKDGTNPNPSSVTVFAEAVNASESSDVYFEFFVDDVSTTSGTPFAAGNDSPFAAQITIASPTTIGSPKKVECQIREGGASNPILARDQIVIFPLKQGSDAITIILSNEAHTLPTTNSGTVTYTDSGTDIEVYEGTNQLGYDGTSPYPNSTYRVSAVGTNVTVSTPTTVTDTSPLDLYSPQTGYVRRYGDHSNMTADNASITYTITVKNDEGKETVFTKKQSLAKSIQGAEGSAGEDGRTVTLSAGDQLFDYDTNGANPVGKNSTNNTTVITAEARNTTGTLYYEFFVDDTSVQLGSSNTYTYTAQADIANMPDKIEVELREGNNSPQSVVARDQFTVFGLQPGSSAITIAMSNEAHSIRTGPNGDSPSAYPNSGTNFDVFEGNTQLGYDDSAPFTAPSYRITADTSPTSDIAIGSATTVGNTRVFAAHSDMVNTDEQIVFSITVKRADGTESTFTRTQTLSKSLTGAAGADGADGADGANGADGDDGKQNASGLVYYTVAQASNPGAPSATSYNFSTRAFTGLTSNWQTTPVEVEISDTTTKYWTSRYDVTETTAGGGTGTPSFDTPSGSINFGANIQSDNYVAGTDGWQIQRDTGDAEFNNVTARGSLKGGKTGPKDYLAFQSPNDDSPAPFDADGIDSPPKLVHTGFYVGPDDRSPTSYDLIIGDDEHQVRFDGSKGRLDLKGVNNLGVAGTFEVKGNSTLPDTVIYDFANEGTTTANETNVSVRMYAGTLDSPTNNSRVAHIVTRTADGGAGAGNTDGRYEIKDTSIARDPGEMTGGAYLTFDQIVLRADDTNTLRFVHFEADGDAHFYNKVGIGRSPTGSYELDVLGDINFTGNLTQNGSTYGGGGGTLTGSGTANTISKWSGSTALTDSLITDNGSTVSIAATLAMGNNNITEVNSITINDPGPNEGLIFGGGNGWSIYESPDDLSTNGAGNLQFVDSGSRILTLNTSGDAEFTGNVGIGTTNPSYLLDVSPTSNGGEIARFKSDTTNAAADVLIVDQDNLSDRAALQVQGNAGSTECLFVGSNGNVGINDTTPSYKLDINDDAATGAGLRVLGGGSGATLARFERDVGSSGCFVDINCSSGDPQIRFTESSGVDWTIGVEGDVFEIVDGNILTGSSKFEINSTGDATTAGDITVQGGVGTFGVADTTNGMLVIHGGATGGEGGELRLYNNADDDSTYDYWRVDSDGSGQFRIGRAGTTDLTIDQSGNFGIGTTSAGDKLEVGGDITLDATDANIKLKSGATGTTGALYYTFNTDSTIYGRLDLPYDTRASMGLRMKSAGGYPITIDSGNGIQFAEDGNTKGGFSNVGDFYVDTDTLFADASADRVGINTNSPSYSLDVIGNSEIDNQTALGSTQYDEQEILRVAGRASNVSTLIFSQFRDAAGSDWTTAGSRIQEKIDSTYMAYMQFNGSGNQQGISWGTGAGTAGPESATQRMVLDSSGNLTVTGDVTAFVSDERLKTRVDTIDNAVEKVCSLSGFIYKFNDTAKDLGYDSEKRQVGLSAQEVEKVLPEVIKPAPVDNKYKTLDYAKVVPLLVEAIKEQQGQIEDLQKKLEEMSK